MPISRQIFCSARVTIRIDDRDRLAFTGFRIERVRRLNIGLRVTDAETRDVALMVLGGMVNKKLVAAIEAAGMPAVGFCGGDGMTFRARRKQVNGSDLGFVGEI